MADFVLVTVVNRGGHLSKDSSRFFLGQHLAVGQIVVKLAARCELHDENHLLSILENCDKDNLMSMERKNSWKCRTDLRKCE